MAQIVDTNSFRQGMMIKWEDSIWEILDCQHHKMGRGGAIVRTKLRNIYSGSIIETSFRAGERFERVVFDERKAQFIYKEGDNYVFMDMESYDQIYVPKSVLGDKALYLSDNLEVSLELYEGNIVGIELPNTVSLKVVDTPPGYKGDTVSGGGKPATLETGLTITVPMFVEVGDIVLVDTRTGEYLERDKSKGA
ncbi:MAG TPA: elongation factor P [Acetomicrobium flavidum]|uniref:Elongation factor P n=2 Tax=Acetomicrobium TaxID=49894 RepID=I4BVV4_ACEMN|nr:elongation factor P [Acetomicrobium mobile]NLG93814.1 elongation factor P [Acetomicrobium flavidum]AFM21411.1 translation elongation factor P [Acetomicrobium mobile DSM 13181]SIN63236.1 translation elongation factor P (EF-P) [Acetomicrobium flavidum]HOJ81574.1 elongation factor P [Acetomicrobium flavidum]HOM30869.1 elongation factor P [Acetomicrobium flavidum]